MKTGNFTNPCQVENSIVLPNPTFRMKRQLMIYALMVIYTMGVSLKTSAQTTLANFSFNTGNSYASIIPDLAPNISATVTGTSAFTTTAGVATGNASFSTNTAGNSLKSSPGNSWTFTLGGTNLNKYKSFKIYYQAIQPTAGFNYINLSYSINGGTYTSNGTGSNLGGNPLLLYTYYTAFWNEAIVSLPSNADNPTNSLSFRLSITNNFYGTIQIDNVQVQAVPDLQVSAFDGSTVCAGTQGKLSLTATGGSVPYSIVYTDGVTNYTSNGISSGVPFIPANNPVSNTSYRLISITDANGLQRTSGFAASVANIVVNPKPSAVATVSGNSLCSGQSVTLTGTAGSLTQKTVGFSNNNYGFFSPYNTAGITRSITSSGLPTNIGAITNITVSTDVIDLWDKNIEIYLIKPGGSISNNPNGNYFNTIVPGGSICLAANRGGYGSGYYGTSFSDAGTDPIGNGTAPFTGTFRPENAFSTLTGDPNGVWTLKVLSDNYDFVGGLLYDWSIKFTFANGVSYVWTSSPAGFSSTQLNPGIVTPTSTTSYNLFVTDLGSNCSAQSTATVAVSQSPTPSIAGPAQVISGIGSHVILSANTPQVGIGSWQVVSGPSTSNNQFSKLNSPTAMFTPMGGAGVYILSWTISNPPCAASSSTVSITINAFNSAPVARAGNDTNLILPANGVVLNATSSTDIDGSISAYQWKKIAGPASFHFDNANSAINNLSGLVEGYYTFQLKVTDNQGAVGFDTVNVIVGSRVLIDLGISPTNNPDSTGKYWNNVTNAQQGVQLQNAITTTNSSTNISLEVVNRIDGTFNPAGPGENTGNTAGNIGDYPASATTDYAFGDPSATDGSWKIGGLDSLKIYSLKFWGTKTVNDNRIIQIKRSEDSTWQEYDAGMNTDYNRAAYFTVSGKTSVTFNIRVKTGSAFGYISVIDINTTPVAGYLLQPAKDSDQINCGRPYTIVVLGSSTTYGYGATPIDSSWVNQYTAYVKRKNPASVVVNLGIPGFTTYNALCPDGFVPPANRPSPTNGFNITAALTYHPDAIIINLPTNDAVNNYSLSEQIANYERTMSLAAAANVPVWVTTTQPRSNISQQQVNNLIQMKDWIYSRFQRNAIDFWSTVSNTDGSIAASYNFDNTHVNNGGHSIFYKRVLSETILDYLCSPNNQPPVAKAGNDAIITLPNNSIVLNGSYSSDEDGAIVSYNWKKVAGPNTYSIADSTTSTLAVSNLVQGVYTWVLTVTDDAGATGTDTVNITVIKLINLAPIANAGNANFVTLPNNSVVLNGAASYDPDGIIVSYNWNLISGPAGSSIAEAGSANTNVNNLVEGVYQFSLTVTDDNGVSSTGYVTISVGNRILIDLGITPTPAVDSSGKYWNNMSSAQNGIQLQNAVTTTNVTTPVTLEVIKRIDGVFNTAGPGENTGNTAGPVGDYPPTATTDYAFADPSETDGTWTISGLDSTAVTNFKFWGTKSVNDTRIIQIKLLEDESWKEYDAGMNADYNRAAYFTVTGKSTVTFKIRVKKGSAFGYISVIDINSVSLKNMQSNGRMANPVATKPVTSAPAVTVYPNPSAGKFTIGLGEVDADGPVSIHILNAQGQIVYQKTVSVADNKTIAIDQSLTNGVYWVNCLIHGQMISRKVIIAQ